MVMRQSSFDAVAARHYLHEHPELSHQEHATTEYLSDQLRRLGIEPNTDFALQTGLVADIGDSASGPTVALRADIDGLPITEDATHTLRSQNDGVMHGCGHDLHMAALLAAAAQLKSTEQTLGGRIRLIFQPAEEIGDGSHEVMATGALDGVDAVIGYHNNPNYRPGTIAIGETMMAGCVRFNVEIDAAGAHAGYPEQGTSPIEALATIVLSLQTIISRDISAFDAAVLSVTEVHGGDVWNVIPTQSGFSGTVRTFSEQVEARIKESFYRKVDAIAASFGVTARITWQQLARPLTNAAELLEIVQQDIPNYAQAGILRRSAAGEDFADYALKAPVVFAFIGSNGEADAPGWHSPQFVGVDETLPTATAFYVRTAKLVLKALAS